MKFTSPAVKERCTFNLILKIKLSSKEKTYQSTLIQTSNKTNNNILQMSTFCKANF